MATDTLGNLFVRITADTRQFSGAMQQTQSQIGGVMRSVQRMAGAFGLAFGAYGAVRYIKSSVAAFAEQEKAVEGLRATLELTGRAGGGALDRLTEKAAELQRVTTAADEELIGATASLGQLAKELDTGELERAQEAIIGIADVFLKGDVNNAAILLGKTLGSTTNALTRYGIQVDSTASQSEKLRQVLAQSQIFFDASKAKAQTLSGRLAQLGNAWGDLKEQVGDVVAQLAGFGTRADSAKGTIVQLTEAIRQNKDEIVAWSKAAGSILVDLLKIGAALLALKTAIGVARGLGLALASVGIVVGTIPVAITALLAALGGGVALFATFKDRVDKAKESLAAFRRESDREIVFRVGLPRDRDLLVDLRNATSRELERVQQDLERFRQRLGDKTFTIALNADVDGPFAEVRRLGDEALALQRRLVELGLAIRDWRPAPDAGSEDVLAGFDLTARLQEAQQELQRWAVAVDTFGRSPLEALNGQIGILESALNDLNNNGIAPTEPAFQALANRYDELVLAAERLQASQQEQQRLWDNVRAGIESVVPSMDTIQQRMVAMAAATQMLVTAFANLDFTAVAAATEKLGAITAGAVQNAVDTAQSVTDQLTSGFVSMGFQMVSGIGQGMEQGAQTLYNILTAIIQKLILIAVAKFIILSPSKLTAGWGENIIKGFAVGFRAQQPDLERAWRSVLDTVAQPDGLQPIRQRIEYTRAAIPPAPDFDALVQQIDMVRGSVPEAPALVPVTQTITYELGNLPKLPDLEPITQTISLAYGQVPQPPDLLPEAMPVNTVATAEPLQPQILVDLSGVTLFGDPASEARKVGSQVYLREGMLVAREGGFDG